ncbi:hypothetical protein Tco_0913783 [Tanacetum coccineum]
MGYAPNNVPFALNLRLLLHLRRIPAKRARASGIRGSRKLKPGALSLYVGDGHRAAVEAIRTYHLELPSGLVIVLNNSHYASSITRGYIMYVVRCARPDVAFAQKHDRRFLNQNSSLEVFLLHWNAGYLEDADTKVADDLNILLLLMHPKEAVMDSYNSFMGMALFHKLEATH